MVDGVVDVSAPSWVLVASLYGKHGLVAVLFRNIHGDTVVARPVVGKKAFLDLGPFKDVEDAVTAMRFLLDPDLTVVKTKRGVGDSIVTTLVTLIFPLV